MEIGQIVYATRGRDCGKFFIVVDMKDKFVYICDGKTRCLERPKKKNIAHVKATKKIVYELKEKLNNKKLTNKQVQKELSNFNINKDILEGKEV